MESAKKSLLFLTTDLPYPLTSGGRIKTFKLLEFLSKQFDVKLICAYGGERSQDIAELRERITLTGFQAFTAHKPRSGFHFFMALMTAPSLNAYRIRSDELTAMVKWSAESSDLVILDHLECIELMPEKFSGKMIYHAHNAEFKLWQEFAALKGSLFTKWALDWEARRVKLLEKYTIARSIFSFLSPNDKEAIQSVWNFKDDAFRQTYHLGNDELLNLPSIDLAKNEKRVFFAGTLDWAPNADGIQWFVQHVWPLVKKQVDNAQLDVCGAGASEELRKILTHTEGVNHHGFVDDLEEIMIKGRCAVVPLRFGSGMKIKTFDAMYRGLPLVTTSVGAEGIKLENKSHAHIVNESVDFANAIIDLLNDTTTATNMRDNARKLARDEYSYSSLLRDMHNSIKEVL